MLQAADLRVFGYIALGLLAIAFVGYLVLRKLGWNPRNVLSDREWRIAVKLVGIALLGLIFYQASVAFDFPAESFIYGRF